jgi:hypothetical protein
MSTLTIGSIVWDIRSYLDRTAYVFGMSHCIQFDPATNGYVMLECGKPIAWGKNAAECLEVSSRIVLDYVARSFVPSWERAECFDYFDVGPNLSSWYL